VDISGYYFTPARSAREKEYSFAQKIQVYSARSIISTPQPLVRKLQQPNQFLSLTFEALAYPVQIVKFWGHAIARLSV
jgi:hypothetical protein